VTALALALGCVGSAGSMPALSAHLDDPGPGVVLGTTPTAAQLQAAVAAGEFPAQPGAGVGDVSGAVTAAAAGTVRALLAAAPVPAGEPGVASLARHVSPSCSGTGTDGNRVQVLYAVEAGRPDRYEQLLTQLRSWVADVDDTFAASAAKSGGGRLVRWVHRDCVPVIAHEVLAVGALSNGFDATISALVERGYAEDARKYLVFADDSSLCGIGQSYQDTARTANANDGAYPTYARVDSPCWAMPEGGHSTAAHELMHMLGGVQDNAPHSTGAGHCNDQADVMCYDDGGPASSMHAVCADQDDLFDCGDDDYFSTHPGAGSYLDLNWNTADSSFLDGAPALAPGPKATLSGVSTLRPGLAGTVTASSPTAGVSYRWTAQPTTCLPATRSAATVQVACPSYYTGKVQLTLAASTRASRTTTVARTVTLLRGPKATISPALKAAKSVSAGKSAKVTVKLTYAKSPVRGEVTLFAQSRTGSWAAVSKARDTGLDGIYTWSLYPKRTTRYAVVLAYDSGAGWRTPAQPTATVRIR
jgi:hypothetical protein